MNNKKKCLRKIANIKTIHFTQPLTGYKKKKLT